MSGLRPSALRAAALGLATAAAVVGLNVALPLITDIVGGRDLADALILLFSAILAFVMTGQSLAYFWEKSDTDLVQSFAERDDEPPPVQRLPVSLDNVLN